jgi:hypothetical protein
MGTRGFVGFVADDEEKISYNQFDSYPTGLGASVMLWAERVDLAAARKEAEALRVVTDTEPPTKADIRRLRPYMDDSTADPPDWYALLRGTQGNPEAILACGYIEDASEFPMDSLFAEWGYMVNFDTGQLEIYRGFQEKPHHGGRFADREQARDGFWPVKLIATFPLDKPDYEALRDLQGR